MKHLKLPATVLPRQMNLMFDCSDLEGLSSLERSKVIAALAQILLQAAGVDAEEFANEWR